MTSVTFDISVVNDNIHEGNESFTLIVMGRSLPNRVSRGSPYVANITIVDTTGELLSAIKC